MTKDDAHRRLQATEREHLVATQAVALLARSAGSDPLLLDRSVLRPSDVSRCGQRLESTYVVLLFAQFEAILRDVWAVGLGKQTRPPMEVLLDRIADLRSVDPATRAEVHTVREYRNSIVHEGAIDRPVPLFRARASLNRYVSFLPLQW